MRTRIRILNKEIRYPDMCPNHPEKTGIAKIRTTTLLPINPLEEGHSNKISIVPFGYEEELFIPVCDKCAEKFDLYKKLSKRLMIMGAIGFIPLILIGNFARNELLKFDTIVPIIILCLCIIICIGWFIGYFANKIPRISPRYKGKKGIDIEMRCNLHYIEKFLRMNPYQEI